ncbi:unnamed protein product [Sphagnum jensenii]|uniref:Integrase zinc-binding domain-containing protein n=1 Tax=Sphagnum jensenii TaxID=128206 RepID=A0ABP1A259_9BRYO
MKIGAIVDVERGLIQVRKGPGDNVKVLPLTMVNLLQNVNSETLEHEAAVTVKSASSEALEMDLRKMLLYDSVMDEEVKVPKSESDTDADDDSEEALQSVEPTNEESEFADTELEELVLKEGPQQILQLTLQDQADDFMKEEISDSNDYADWIQWVSDAERGEPNSRESALCAEVPTVLQVHQVNRKEAHPKQFASSAGYLKMSTRWQEISQKIRVDHNLGEEKQQQLWRMLGKYQDVYQALKVALVNAPVLTRPDFKRTFWLDVDWSPKGVGAILSQKEAQELSEFGDHELDPTGSDDEEDHGAKSSSVDIWEDTDCLALLKEGVLPITVDIEEGKRIRKRASTYCWKEQQLFFKGLYVPKPEERMSLVRRMHEDLGHSGEQRTLPEIRRRYFWRSRTTDVKAVSIVEMWKRMQRSLYRK